MSNYEKKEGDISIFKNNDATEENKRPQYRGTALIDGKEKDVSLWVRESKDGMKYFSGQVKPKWVKEDTAHDDIAQPEEDNSDLPF